MNLYAQTTIDGLSVHRVRHGEMSQLILSEQTLPITPDLEEVLITDLISPTLKREEDYKFTFSNGDPKLNPMYQLASQIFNSDKEFHQGTQSITKHLYQSSTHPNIKSGDVVIMSLKNIPIEDELLNGLAIFKSESAEQFVTFNEKDHQISMQVEMGALLKKLDKAVLILDTLQEFGYSIKMYDRTNGNQESKYWEKDFLNLAIADSPYNNMTQYMNLTQSYLKHQISEEFDISPLDQKLLLKQSIDFFDTKDSFSQEEFKEEVLQNANVIDSFNTFTDNYQREVEVTFSDEIKVSDKAVKKGKKHFKSVLKLDKNFHIYIHGDHKMIEKGKAPDGRKYYKVYYEEEK